jgi:hypothetical protein
MFEHIVHIYSVKRGWTIGTNSSSMFVCLLQCVPQGRDVFANYTGTILQVTIIIPSHDPRS